MRKATQYSYYFSKLRRYNLIVLLLVFGCLSSAAFFVQHLNAERPLAIVRRIKPEVKVNQSGSETKGWTDATRGQQLFDSDTLQTGSEGYAAVQFMDKSTVKLKPNSLLILNGEVKDKNSTATRLALEVGEIFLNVKERRSDFEVAGNSSLAVVQGTEFGAEADNSGSNRYWVTQGTVELTALRSGESVSLTKGMFGEVGSDGSSLTSGYLSEEELNRLQEEYDKLDRNATPKKLKLRFKNEDGDTREIDVQYYQND